MVYPQKFKSFAITKQFTTDFIGPDCSKIDWDVSNLNINSEVNLESQTIIDLPDKTVLYSDYCPSAILSLNSGVPSFI